MIIHNNVALPENRRIEGQAAGARPVNAGMAQSGAFGEILNNKVAEQQSLQFSRHASLRLNSRDISLSSDQLARVESGVSKAREKGIKDSLVFVDNVALVVNVKSKTVVTAMSNEKNSESEKLFTNIDGAVIV